MFDGALRRLIHTPLQHMARLCIHAGCSANMITLTGFAFGLAGAVAVWQGAFLWGLAGLVLNRCLDGLDGAIARQAGPTALGGFLDIVLDFGVYAAFPLAFAALDPEANALAACALLAGFLANGAAFFAWASLHPAQGRTGHESWREQKALPYLAGLAEGGETVAFFLAFCLWPELFPILASLFALLCLVSALARCLMAWRALRAGD